MRTMRNAAGLLSFGSCARVVLRSILLAALAAVLSDDALGTTYTFVNIADSDGIFTTTWGVGPSINASGVVAFLGILDAGGSGIFVGNGSTVTPIALTGSTYTSFGTQDTPINNSGFVAFFASPAAGGGAVFASDGTTTKTIASGPPFNTLPSNAIVSINNAGAVAFEHGTTGATSALYVGNGSAAPTALYRASDPMFSLIATRMAINDSGQVAFSAFLDAGGSGVYRGDGGTPTPIALSSQGFSTFNNPGVSINNAGTVVFIGGLNGSQHVFTGDGGPTTSIVDTTGAFATLSFPAINSAGRVAFSATDPSVTKHLQSGPDPVTDKVIKAGDPLFGSVVNDLRFASSGLNDAGQIAFYYSLTDGRKGIARATPVLQLVSAVSQKEHIGAGTFDIKLPLTGDSGIECRGGGGTHTLVFSFTNIITSGSAAVTGGTGSAAPPTFFDRTMTVNLSGVTDVQKITITLSNVTDTLGQVLPDTAVSVRILRGDSNGDGSVNSADAQQTRNQSGQSTGAANFRTDFNLDGAINAADATIVRAASGHAVSP